jgi:lysophospholipase L1-like esterase
MFKSQYRPRPLNRPLFSKRKPKRFHFSIIRLSIALPIILICLEALTRILVGFSGKNEQFKVKSVQPPQVSAYSLKFVNEQQQTYATLAKDGSLVAQRSLSVGYELKENQKNQFWQTNDRGFRDRVNLPLDKPKNEIRIFLIGGSTAFGQFNSSNEATIAAYLQTLLRRRIEQQQRSPDAFRPNALPLDPTKRQEALAKPLPIEAGKYRVINAAVPGYTSGNQLAQLAVEILPYKPDAIVVLDGYSDLMLPSSEKLTDIPELEKYINNPLIHFRAYLSQAFKPVFEHSYLAREIQSWVDYKPPLVAQTSLVLTEETKPIEQYLPEDKKELNQRVERYFQNHKQIARLCAGARIPLTIALQPEITGHNFSKLSANEKEIVVQLGRKYLQKMKSNYPAFVASGYRLQKYLPKNIQFVNFYNKSNSLPVPIFSDAIHLTDDANAAIAEQLFETIVASPKMKPKQPVTDTSNKPGLLPRTRTYTLPQKRFNIFPQKQPNRLIDRGTGV